MDEQPRDRSATAAVGPTDARAVRRRGAGPHSVLVVAPISLWVGVLVLDAGSRYGVDPAFLVRTATWLVGAGLLASVVAGIAGAVEAAPVAPGTRAYRRVVLHLYLALLTVVFWVVALILRLAMVTGGPATTPMIVLSAAGAVLVSVVVVVGRAVARARRHHAC